MPNKVTTFATKKVGPLPVWAWGLGIVVFVGVVWYLRKNAGEDTSVSVTDSDYGQEPIGPAPPSQDNGGGGGGVIDIPLPEPLPSPGPIPPPDWPYVPIEPVSPIYEQPSEPVATQPPPEAPEQPAPEPKPKPAPTKQTEFQYFGETWRKGDLARFRKKLKSLPKHSMYSGPNGYAVWAKNHPKVVADFGWPKK